MSKTSKYKIEFKGSGDLALFSDNITFAQLNFNLDDPGVAEIHIAFDYQKAKNLSLDKVPEKVNISIDDKIIFKGHICSSRFKSKATVVLIFKDPIQLLDNVNCEFFKQDISYEDCIKEALKGSALNANFIGDFSGMANSYHVEMLNASQLLDKMSREFAFHYKYQPKTDKIDFIKIGEKLEEHSFQNEDAINLISNDHTAEQMSDDIEYSYLSTSSTELKTESIDANKVASSYQELSKSGSFKARAKWPSAKGKFKFRFSTKKKFEQAKDILLNTSLKESVDQDSLSLEMFYLKALPGDQFRIKNTLYPGIQDGLYLVKAAQITFSGNAPRIIIQGVRP